MEQTTKSYKLKASDGFLLLEAILAGALLILIVSVFVIAAISGQESSALSGKRGRATLLAEEGLEAARAIRDAGFSNLGDGAHGLAIANDQWTFSNSQDATDIFTRQISISPVDSTTKDISSTVYWQQNAQSTGSVTLVTRFTDWLESVSTWLDPFRQASLDLSGSENGLKVQTSGAYAYVVRNDGSPDFAVIDVSNPAMPSLAASLSLSGAPSNIAVSGNYAYISSSNNSQELQIIDISTPTAPVVVGTFNASGEADGKGVYAIGSTVYLVRESGADNEFVIINASNPANPSLIGSLNLNATGFEVFALGSRAYVASGRDNQELQIIDIANPFTPSLIGSYNLPGTTNALTITGFANTILLGQGNTLQILDVTNPAAPISLGSTNLSGTVNDLTLGNANTLVFAATAAGNAEFAVIDIADLTNSSVIGTVTISGNSRLNGIAYDETKNRAYGVSDLNVEEFMVFASP